MYIYIRMYTCLLVHSVDHCNQVEHQENHHCQSLVHTMSHYLNMCLWCTKALMARLKLLTYMYIHMYDYICDQIREKPASTHTTAKHFSPSNNSCRC